MAKPGPKPKVTPAVKAEIVAALELGLSLADTLLMLGVKRSTYQDAVSADDGFRQGVKGAAARGKQHHLKRVTNAEERWQASAWFLERKYGAEYGQKLRVDHGGSVRVVEQVVEAEGVTAHGSEASLGNGHCAAAPGASRLPPE